MKPVKTKSPESGLSTPFHTVHDISKRTRNGDWDSIYPSWEGVMIYLRGLAMWTGSQYILLGRAIPRMVYAIVLFAGSMENLHQQLNICSKKGDQRRLKFISEK